jgi:hypothetical protein
MILRHQNQAATFSNVEEVQMRGVSPPLLMRHSGTPFTFFNEAVGVMGYSHFMGLEQENISPHATCNTRLPLTETLQPRTRSFYPIALKHNRGFTHADMG